MFSKKLYTVTENENWVSAVSSFTFIRNYPVTYTSKRNKDSQIGYIFRYIEYLYLY